MYGQDSSHHLSLGPFVNAWYKLGMAGIEAHTSGAHAECPCSCFSPFPNHPATLSSIILSTLLSSMLVYTCMHLTTVITPIPTIPCIHLVKARLCTGPGGMKVIRHAGVDSRMIILDNQARQQMTRYFQLSLQCNVLPITVCLTVLVNFLVPNSTQEGGHLEGEKTFVTDKDLCQLQKF